MADKHVLSLNQIGIHIKISKGKVIIKKALINEWQKFRDKEKTDGIYNEIEKMRRISNKY